MGVQEDLLDVLYWLRQIIAILAGVAWGLVPLTGLYAFVGVRLQSHPILSLVTTWLVGDQRLGCCHLLCRYMALCLGAPYFWYHSQECVSHHQATWLRAVLLE